MQHKSLFIILWVHSTCFGCQIHPSSGVHKIVTTGSGTGHIFCAAASLQRGQVAALEWGSYTVLETVVTVLCTPDNGCGWHPKYGEWTRGIITRLLCVASRWTIIDILWYKHKECRTIFMIFRLVLRICVRNCPSMPLNYPHIYFPLLVSWFELHMH